MASSGLSVVSPTTPVPMETIAAIIPSLGRVSLRNATESLQKQTHPIDQFIIKEGSEDTLIKIKEAVNEAQTEYIIIADDDAVYPESWVEQLLKPYRENVGFVGGPCLPLVDEESSSAEKAISEVSSSFLGTTNMSYRNKATGKIRDADETNLVGNGLYRRSVFAKILNEEFDKIPPAAWETYVFTRIKKLGYRTIFNPGAAFKHAPRKNIFSFSKQIIRCGIGRMNFFKQFPGEIPTKFYMFFPMLFIVYLIAFFGFALANFPIVSNLPLIIYLALVVIVSYYGKHSSRFQPFYYLAIHFSYGLGMIYGLISNKRTWA